MYFRFSDSISIHLNHCYTTLIKNILIWMISLLFCSLMVILCPSNDNICTCSEKLDFLFSHLSKVPKIRCMFCIWFRDTMNTCETMLYEYRYKSTFRHFPLNLTNCLRIKKLTPLNITLI